MLRLALPTALVALMVGTPLAAQDCGTQPNNRIDCQRDDAPELAAYGPLSVGVRQFQFTNPDQVDVNALYGLTGPITDLPRYDRTMTVETWYPSVAGSLGDTSLDAIIRDGTTTVALEGRAVRDAAPLASANPFPLVILSHGYPGNRFLLSHLAENLASKGYVVASIDHPDSTYSDLGQFGSTLVNRPLDQLFVLNEMARLNTDASSGLTGLIDTDNTGLIGYSMGGYGALIAAGAGVTQAAVNFVPGNALAIHQAGSATHEALPDPRIRTAVTIGPWGRQAGVFDAEGLAGIDIPLLVIGGSDDTISGYATGIRPIWEEAVGSERALLTFDGGGHNVAAPIPAPAESFYFNPALGFNVSEHYTDPIWDTVFTNNVAQHFVTAWLDLELKGDASRNAFLDLIPIGSDGMFSVNPDGSLAPDNTYWTGFVNGSAEGLRYETMNVVPLPASVWMLAMAIAGLGGLRARHRARPA